MATDPPELTGIVYPRKCTDEHIAALARLLMQSSEEGIPSTELTELSFTDRAKLADMLRMFGYYTHWRNSKVYLATYR